MILNLDCRHGLAMLPDNSVDAIVCDPPYGLRFMGKKWDYDVPGVDIWVECLRVLKPGGHLLAFAGTRTQHRMAVRIEDAGFEIRDMIAWVYGSGFPKSRDISKDMDRREGVEREVVGVRNAPGMAKQNVIQGAQSRTTTQFAEYSKVAISDLAKQWEGWGTAIKPALEPITVARKPLIGTVAANVAEYGTGAINIDACRVGDEVLPECRSGSTALMGGLAGTSSQGGAVTAERIGRYPANLIHDGSDEVLAHFPDSAGSGGSVPNVKIRGYRDGAVGTGFAEYLGGERTKVDCGTGSAARFFYCAKAGKRDRNEGLEAFDAVMANFAAGTGLSKNGDGSPRNMNADAKNPHPTVKPTELMRYLCRLVTPPGGLIVDPFAGSGSTGKAAILEGFQFVGFELDPQYTAIANARVEAARASMREPA